MSIDFRNVRIAEIPLVRDLFEGFYGSNYCEVEDTYFRWLHRENPDLGPTVGDDEVTAFGCFDGKDLVACINYVPFKLFVGGESVSACWSVGWRSKPGHGSLTGLQLRKHLRKFDVYMSMGATDWVRSIYQSRFGFEYCNNIERFLAVIDPQACFELLGRNRCLAEADRSSLAELGAKSDQAQSTSFFESQWDSLANECYWSDHLSRTSATCSRRFEWLKWRYKDHPHLKYVPISADQDSATGVAFVRVEQIRDLDFRVLRVLDFLPTSGSEAELASAIVAYGFQVGASFVDFFCSSTSVADGLGEAFFRGSVRRDLDFPRLFFPLEWRERWSINASLRDNRNSPESLKLSDVYFTKADPSQDILLNREYVTKGL